MASVTLSMLLLLNTALWITAVPYTGYRYNGMFKEKCADDGFYYSDVKSFIICSNGIKYELPCGPGSQNSPYGDYVKGDSYGYRDFCDVNLVDEGYNSRQPPPDVGYTYNGYYKGRCYGNGVYHMEDSSFMLCRDGETFDLPCPHGVFNHPEGFFTGTMYNFQDFCRVHVLDGGDSAKRVSKAYDYKPEITEPEEYEPMQTVEKPEVEEYSPTEPTAPLPDKPIEIPYEPKVAEYQPEEGEVNKMENKPSSSTSESESMSNSAEEPEEKGEAKSYFPSNPELPEPAYNRPREDPPMMDKDPKPASKLSPKTYGPPRKTYNPSQNAYDPLQKAYVPPEKTYDNPKKAYKVPMKEHSPSTKVYNPPKSMYDPPYAPHLRPHDHHRPDYFPNSASTSQEDVVYGISKKDDTEYHSLSTSAESLEMYHSGSSEQGKARTYVPVERLHHVEMGYGHHVPKYLPAHLPRPRMDMVY